VYIVGHRNASSLDRYNDTVELAREVAMCSMGPASEINLNGPQVNTYEALKNDVAKDYIEHHVVRVSGQLSLPFSQVHEELDVVYHNIEPEIAVYPCAPDDFQSKSAGKKLVTNEPTNFDDFIFSRQVPSLSAQCLPVLPISHYEPPRASSSSGQFARASSSSDQPTRASSSSDQLTRASSSSDQPPRIPPATSSNQLGLQTPPITFRNQPLQNPLGIYNTPQRGLGSFISIRLFQQDLLQVV
jgi:hypothetical protein